MQNNGHLPKVASVTVPTTLLFTAALILFLSSPLTLNQLAHSQLTTNPGSQNLSSLFKNLEKESKNLPSISSLLKNFLKPEKEVSGHYTNPQFGITDIVFPDGWYGREVPSTVGLTVIMHPGIENRSLFAISTPFTGPQMLLQVMNNSELASLSAEGGTPHSLSLSKICNPLAQNTTSVIDGKTFNVATVECPLSSVMSAAGQAAQSMGNISNQSNFAPNGPLSGMLSKSLNPNAVVQAKLYEFKAPDKTYRLSLVVSNLFASSTEKPDISKYAQLLDATANTLKLG